jgi:hypothetical protein
MEENKKISVGAQKSEQLPLRTRENNTQRMILHKNARYGKFSFGPEICLAWHFALGCDIN